MKVRMFIKRALDFMIALLALIILMPVYLLLGFLVYINLGSPVFFIHERPGKEGKPFNMLKFRSMINTRDRSGNLLPNEARLTPFGKALRSTSLDELPELLNVLKGEMSLVGPRPLLPQYLSLYNERQMKRHLVRPGITGWAQVNGRNSISWEDKFDHDVWYVENWSLILDFKILLMTICKVFKREGINQSDNSTSERWQGNIQS